MSERVKGYRANLRVLFGETNPYVRSGIRQALASKGFTGTEICYDLDQVTHGLGKTDLDVLVLDTELDGVDGCDYVRDIRHGRVGANPFVVIILTTWNSDDTAVARMLGCGSDDLIIKPMSATQLSRRIEQFIEVRKPFLSTRDYVGPDRRSGMRRAGFGSVESGQDGELIEVPNTLRMKSLGQPIRPANLLEDVAKAQDNMAEHRLSRDVARCVRLARQVAVRLNASDFSERVQTNLGELGKVSGDLILTSVSRGRPHLVPLARALQRTVVAIQSCGGELGARDIALLSELARAIDVAWKSTQSAAASAKIGDVVSGFRTTSEPRPASEASAAMGAFRVAKSA